MLLVSSPDSVLAAGEFQHTAVSFETSARRRNLTGILLVCHIVFGPKQNEAWTVFFEFAIFYLLLVISSSC